MKILLLAISIVVLLSSNTYANEGEVFIICFQNRISATGCLGALAVLINPAPYVIATSLSALGYSIYSYREDFYNCKEDEITMDQIENAKRDLEKQTDKISVVRYHALRSLLAYSNPCHSLSEFHQVHDGALYGKIRYSKEEIDIIFDYIIGMSREKSSFNLDEVK